MPGFLLIRAYSILGFLLIWQRGNMFGFSNYMAWDMLVFSLHGRGHVRFSPYMAWGMLGLPNYMAGDMFFFLPTCHGACWVFLIIWQGTCSFFLPTWHGAYWVFLIIWQGTC